MWNEACSERPVGSSWSLALQNSRGTNNSIRPFSPTHAVLYALLYYCCHTAPLLGGTEQRTDATYTLPWSSAWGERGIDRPVVLIPSMYHNWSRPEGTGCLEWFCVTCLCEGFAWCNGYHLASSRRQTALVDIAQGLRQSNHDTLWFYSLLWWCFSLDTASSAWMVWTDPPLFNVGFFLYPSFIKDFVSVSQTHLSVIRTEPSLEVCEVSWLRWIFPPPY